MTIQQPRIKIYQQADILNFVTSRKEEEKIGDDVALLEKAIPKALSSLLENAYKKGARYALLGIPEGFGPVANMGRPGAEGAWEVCLEKLLNMQSNQFVDASQVLVLGHVEVKDLVRKAKKLDNGKEKDLKKLRDTCAELDERVYPLVKEIVAAGMEPIVIGGGHNNAYPILKGVNEGFLQKEVIEKKGIACINCDPHADFRPLEGRHSGNGFSYAHDAGLLAAYYVFGLHESYNSQEMLARISNLKEVDYTTFEQFKVRGEFSFDEALGKALAFFRSHKVPLGIELDLDAIKDMPVSAMTPTGISVEEARGFVHFFASQKETAYFHIAEGAPSLSKDGKNKVGKSIASLVVDYVKARTAYAQK